MMDVSTSWISPTCPSLGPAGLHESVFASTPLSPTAGMPARFSARTILRLMVPPRTVSMTSITSGVVTRCPSMNSHVIPRFVSSALIIGPPP